MNEVTAKVVLAQLFDRMDASQLDSEEVQSPAYIDGNKSDDAGVDVDVDVDVDERTSLLK